MGRARMNQRWGRDNRRTIEDPIDGRRVSHTTSYNMAIKRAMMPKTVLREGRRLCRGWRVVRLIHVI
uniref:Transposase n=1 Tax=Ascaris lumbricoides TaxID=6252 RepID=A0A0M3HTH0_ASCLU